ncbi:uncharacterized protein [Littorina saxatilis]|uniref:uncharacterized protein isoform X2 n=1 Tax=Littorina saxatilis TaxID=31220 RepID=UPI0038B54395
MARCVVPVLQTCDSDRDSVYTALHPVLSAHPSSSSRMSSLWLVVVWSVVLLACPAASSALPSGQGVQCPELCNGQGEVVGGWCRCAEGWTGTDCSLREHRCAVPSCNDNGHCINGHCVCFQGFQGPDCGLGGPFVQVSPSNEEVERGGTATLQCVVTGNPPPTVVWSRLWGQLDEASGRVTVSADGTLRISNVQDQDDGNYLCRASNSLGNIEVMARISVTE